MMTNWLVKLFVKNPTDTENSSVRGAYGKMAGWVGIFCNVLLFASKIVVGTLSGSISITADAINNLSDASSSVIALVGFKLSAKPADAEHPFGHARVEYISGLVVAVMVLVIGVELGKSSFEKILTPTEVNYTVWSFAILIFSIILKIWMARFNMNIGNRIGSTTLKATYEDSRNDVITTAAVLVSAVITSVTGINLDGWMGLAVAIFILISGVGLVKETLNPLLGEAPDPELVGYIDNKINSYEGVLGTHDLILHDYGPGRRYVSAHVEMSSKQDVLVSHDTIDNIEKDFLQQDNIHLIIHYDPVAVDDEKTNVAHAQLKKCLEKINPAITFHDLRLVDGPTHTNYVFDVVLPDDYAIDPKELKSKVEEAIQVDGKRAYATITIDQYYTTNGK